MLPNGKRLLFPAIYDPMDDELTYYIAVAAEDGSSRNDENAECDDEKAAGPGPPR